MLVEFPLTHREARLLAELLESDALRLYPEVRRTAARKVRADLTRRLTAVERLKERLKECLATDAEPVTRRREGRNTLQCRRRS